MTITTRITQLWNLREARGFREDIKDIYKNDDDDADNDDDNDNNHKKNNIIPNQT